jgi:multiple sugar transport system permease protein
MKKTGWPRYLVLGLLALLVLFPVIYTVSNSFMGNSEILHYYGDLVSADAKNGGHWLPFHLIPDGFSLDGFYQILLRRPDYLVKFWNSLFLTGAIVLGQTLLSCLAGYGFAKYRFPGSQGLFVVIVILMLMPYQVTLVSNYIVLDKVGLIGSYLSVILPGIFAPFGVFWMRQVMDGVPDELMESASLDGAGQWRILWQIMVPCCKGGLASLITLSFVDNWNMVEQPLIFLKKWSMYPLSIFLSQINEETLGAAFASGLLAMLPVALLFAFFQDELVEGISLSSFK